MERQLYLLRPREELDDDNNPWEPWYDKAFGFVVCATSEAEAREYAQKKSGDETWVCDEERALRGAKGFPAWTSEEYSTCELLTADRAAGVVIRDFASG